jgi:hypothetical protein
MPSIRHVAAFTFVFLQVFRGQTGQGAEAWTRLEQIDNVLRSAHVSGSLTYQGSCGLTVPEALPLKALSEYSDPPSEVLQKMFASVPHMRVTEEPKGIVRMVETDVLTDFLDFKIKHLAFYSSLGDNTLSHGANMALMAIEVNPEVRAFREAHHIGPNFNGNMPGDAASGKPVVYGKLEGVTVSKALDRILQTIPGFWIYENCVGKGGERTVRLSFYERPSPWQDQP